MPSWVAAGNARLCRNQDSCLCAGKRGSVKEHGSAPTVQLAFPVQGQSRRQTNKNGTQKFQAVKANKYSKSNNIMLAAARMAKL